MHSLDCAAKAVEAKFLSRAVSKLGHTVGIENEHIAFVELQ